jgi:hypothetical protein
MKTIPVWSRQKCASKYLYRCLLNIGMKKGKENPGKKLKKANHKSPKRNWVHECLEKWALAAGKNDCDALDLKGAPEWVHNAYAECAKITFPSGLPAVEKWDAEFLGEFLGRFAALERFYAGEVPLGPETQADLEKVKAMTAQQPASDNFRAIEKDLETRFKATNEAIPQATALAVNSTYGENLSFQKGLQRGIEIKPDELATSRTFRRHTRTFWVLALHWRVWVKCRSVGEVYRHLCNAVGEAKIGSFKTFETHVAKKIGLKFRGRGRPKSAK